MVCFNEIIPIVLKIIETSYLPVLTFCTQHLMLKFYLVIVELIGIRFNFNINTLSVNYRSHISSAGIG